MKIKKKHILFNLYVPTLGYQVFMFVEEKDLSFLFPFTSHEMYTGYYLELFFFNKNVSISFEL